jgi:hypothetical protein
MAMDSRAEKYQDKNLRIGSRTARNTDLYKEINKTELDNFEVKSNATVIGNNRSNIDVEKIKDILDTHYKDVPQRRGIQIETNQPQKEQRPIFETKEYDINVIIDKAKEDKVESYEEERSKKLRNTQFDILNNLKIDPNDYIEDYEEEPQIKNEEPSHTTSNVKELEKLINTITINEKTDSKKKPTANQIEVSKTSTNKNDKKDADPLDIFEDLKGDDTTAVLEGLKEKTEKMIQQIEETTSFEDSFFTKENSFKKTDFEDYQELEEETAGPIIKIAIIVLLIVFVIGVIILVKSLL